MIVESSATRDVANISDASSGPRPDRSPTDRRVTGAAVEGEVTPAEPTEAAMHSEAMQKCLCRRSLR
jgi:hypothetical protein